MKYIIYFLVSMSFIGCSGRSLENAIDNGMVTLSGNKPPSFFKIANTQTMSDYVFDVKDATFSLPKTKEKDFTVMGGWEGSVDYSKDVTLYMSEHGITYHMHITSSIYKYGNDEIALENGDMEFFNKKYPQSTYKNGKIVSINKHIEYHGQEKYPCFVSKFKEPYFKATGRSFGCYKSNPQKTMVKRIGIRLNYTNPSLKKTCPSWIEKQCDPDSKVFNAEKFCEQAKETCSEKNIKKTEQLSKEYTYEDLLQRAKRVLDSLYIKDGWEK